MKINFPIHEFDKVDGYERQIRFKSYQSNQSKCEFICRCILFICTLLSIGTVTIFIFIGLMVTTSYEEITTSKIIILISLFCSFILFISISTIGTICITPDEKKINEKLEMDVISNITCKTEMITV